MEELHSGLHEDELELVQAGLDFEREDEYRERLAAGKWFDVMPESRVLVARRVEHPNVVARFIRYAFIAPRRGDIAPPGWYLPGYLARRPSGELVLHSIWIWPEGPDQIGVTTDILRAIKPGRLVASIRPYLDVLPDPLELEEGRRAHARRGRPPLSDELLERVAHELIAEYEVNGAGALRRVAERLAGDEGLHPDTARRRAREATRRGLLAPRESGQSVFAPGWRLLPRRQPTYEFDRNDAEGEPR